MEEGSRVMEEGSRVMEEGSRVMEEGSRVMEEGSPMGFKFIAGSARRVSAKTSARMHLQTYMARLETRKARKRRRLPRPTQLLIQLRVQTCQTNGKENAFGGGEGRMKRSAHEHKEHTAHMQAW